MEKRADPGRAGVKAGRVVGVSTAALAVWSLWQARSVFGRSAEVLLGVVSIESGLPVTALFWANVLLAAVTRYTVCYVVGSLVGVCYDWLDRPPLPVLVAIVLAVGLFDGALATLDTGEALVGIGYVLAWLCYVPAFLWLFDEDAEHLRTGPKRLGD